MKRLLIAVFTVIGLCVSLPASDFSFVFGGMGTHPDILFDILPYLSTPGSQLQRSGAHFGNVKPRLFLLAVAGTTKWSYGQTVWVPLSFPEPQDSIQMLQKILELITFGP